MRPRDYVLEQIQHRETQPVPYTLPMEPVVAENLDRYYGGPGWRNWLVPYIVGVSAVDTDYKEPIGDGLARDTYGSIWRMDRRPWHLEKPVLQEPSLDGYKFPEPEEFYRPQSKTEGFRVCEEKKDSFLIGNLGWGLFERSWTLRGFENALVDAAVHPDFYEEVLDRLVDLYMGLLEYTLDLPVDAIMFGDDWGDQRGVILGPERWRRLIKPRWAKLYQRAHDSGRIVITHSCGSVAEIIPDLIEIGLDVLESVQPEAAGMNPYELKRRWGDKITFWGGLGSQTVIPFGTPAQIRKEVERLRSEMGRGGGYILAPAKPLQPETPVENAAAVLEAFVER